MSDRGDQTATDAQAAVERTGRSGRGAVGVDIGGSGIRAARHGVSGSPAVAPLERELDGGALLSRIVDTVRAVSATPPHALAVAIPSFVDATGAVLQCPALPGLEGLRLGDELRARLGTPAVTVVPDIAAAVTGEYTFGTGRGVGRFLCVALGTGANAGAIVDGRLLETAYGSLGDAGHVIVDVAGPACTCGGQGCLEAVTSGWALTRDGNRAGIGDAPAVTLAAERGEQRAIKLLERAGRALGRAMATWSCLLWPQRIAVAGGLVGAGELLLLPARDELQRVGVPNIVGDIEVVAAELGQTATLAGAVELAAGLGNLQAREPDSDI